MFQWRGVVNCTLATVGEADVNGALRCSVSLCSHSGLETQVKGLSANLQGAWFTAPS